MPPTVNSTLVQHLRDEIIRGTFSPGERLRLEDLARRFGVSTMPIRQALRTLEAEGIVTVEPHKGAQVTRFTPQHILELFEIRAALEQLATTKAVPQLSHDNLAHLTHLLHQMDTVLHQQPLDMAQFALLNAEFHGYLYDQARRPLLATQIHERRFQVQHYLGQQSHQTGPEINDEHRLILSLARNGQAELAGIAMYQHILATGERISEALAFG